ncbi:unnamed protein product [Durusdinium trenchii]|uniref:Major facilitator superfamily (MFS) profile domain-containing protein n=2 Tax=Durusdinium trenchii TaxID=1381693 RepID=A0ABP0I156_9DINO
MPKETIKPRNSWSGVWDVLLIYWALLLGNVLEWYEFAVFSFLEPYIQRHFFHDSAISTWLTFACTFIMRPVGGLALGLLGDLFGRKVSTFVSIFGMMLGTVGQGMLPTYQNGDVAGSIGVALLVLLRLLQGICTGGEIAAVSTYITEVGSKDSLARSIMLIGITCSMGFLFAQSMSYAMELIGEEKMRNWGWRLPFIVAVIPGSIATLGRRCMPESSQFLEGRARQACESEASESSGSTRGACKKMQNLLSMYWPTLLVGMGSAAAVSFLQYGGLVWCSVLLQKKGTNHSILLAAGITARISSMVWAPLVAWLADVQGIAWILFLGSCTMAFLGMPLYMVMVANHNSFAAVVGCYGLGYGLILSFVGVCNMLYLVELFPVEVRNAGVGLSYNFGFCCFGGFAPMIFEAAFQSYAWAPGCFLSLAGLITTTSVVTSLLLQRRGKMQLAHIRPEPYFSPCGCQQNSENLEDITL